MKNAAIYLHRIQFVGLHIACTDRVWDSWRCSAHKVVRSH